MPVDEHLCYQIARVHTKEEANTGFLTHVDFNDIPTAGVTNMTGNHENANGPMRLKLNRFRMDY
jgi:hypothetical protein